MSQIDTIVHNFISKLLYIGEEEQNLRSRETLGMPEAQRHLKENLLKHQDEVIAIKDKIKPGFCAMFFTAFTKEMVSTYLFELSLQELDEELEIEHVHKQVEAQLREHMDLNLTSPKANGHGFNDLLAQETIQRAQLMKEELTVKLELNQAGIRKAPTSSRFDSQNKDIYIKNRQTESIPRSS